MGDLGWTATLIVSELAANAALHARGDQFRVEVSTGSDGVRLEIHDMSLRLPQQRSYSHEATTGRGLKLVSELAQEWGVEPTASGKIVWALLRAGTADSDDDADVDALLEAFGDDAGEVIPLFDRREPQARAAHHTAAA
jgi:hypothetical protein